MIPVNIAVGETDLRTASTDDIAACWRRHGIDSSQVHRIEDPGTLESAVRVSRFGVELWTFFLIAALALAILEMLVGRIPKREALDVQ